MDMEANEPTSKATTPILEVMICTYGDEGIKRVASSSHPATEGVRYLVSWQTDSDSMLPETLRRPDFRIIRTPSKGISANRNFALANAKAPFLLISDDDVDYTEEGLKKVIEAFRSHPEADIIAFRFECALSEKPYPEVPVSLATPPKGYFVSSIEIALRKDSVKGKIWFNENFGIGAMFPSGEEDIFLRDCLDLGLYGIFIPATIARHEGPTTAEYNVMLPSRPQAKGAVFLRLHPTDWPLRLLTHAIREFRLWRLGLSPSPITFCREWLNGVRQARKAKVFPTPPPSQHPSSHE